MTTAAQPVIYRTPTYHSTNDPFDHLIPSDQSLPHSTYFPTFSAAKSQSDAIDVLLASEAHQLKRRAKNKLDVKLLLLGQAESGKSTLQKQFQLLYAPHSLEEERKSWKVVIYLNIVRAVKSVLDALTDADNQKPPSPAPNLDPDQTPGPSTSTSDNSISQDVSPPPLDRTKEQDRELAETRLRLTPILTMEESLAAALIGPGVQLSSNTPQQGFYSRFGWQWSSRRKSHRRSFTAPSPSSLTPSSPTTDSSTTLSPTKEEEQPTAIDNSSVLVPTERILTACSNDITFLWTHAVVRDLVTRRKLKLSEWSEYFLSNIPRIAPPTSDSLTITTSGTSIYNPTDTDILRARLQTIGVSEHKFVVTNSPSSEKDREKDKERTEWHLYDVGGARGQRHIWASFFMEANAIIFLAPLSAFDQNLEEDPTTNRIADSISLFKSVCSNKLLANVHMVLFLNKSDLLRQKLESGVQVRRYVTSFGDRANTYDDVVAYFKTHYVHAHKSSRIRSRVLYTHVTNMVDTKATRKIIDNVRDTLFRTSLKTAALID